MTPGAISISFSSTVISKLRSLPPSGKSLNSPVYQSVSMLVGSKPLRALSTVPTVIIDPWAALWGGTAAGSLVVAVPLPMSMPAWLPAPASWAAVLLA